MLNINYNHKKDRREYQKDLTRIHPEIEIAPLIEPNEGNPRQVTVKDSPHSPLPRESVRGALSEDVPHVTTRGYLHTATAHPNLPHKCHKLLNKVQRKVLFLGRETFFFFFFFF